MKKYWSYLRTLIFLVGGIFNTLLLRPEDIGSLKNYIGYLLLVFAVYDIILFLLKRLRNK